MQTKGHTYDIWDVVRFLHLSRRISGKLLVIWDGSPIHRARVIGDFLKREHGQRSASGTLTRISS